MLEEKGVTLVEGNEEEKEKRRNLILKWRTNGVRIEFFWDGFPLEAMITYLVISGRGVRLEMGQIC